MASHIKDWEIVRAVMFDCICLAVLTEVSSILHAITGRRERERESERVFLLLLLLCSSHSPTSDPKAGGAAGF